MSGDHLEEHAIGVELQLNELVDRLERAVVQGDHTRAALLEAEIEELQSDLAETSERIADPARVADVHAPEPDESFGEL